MFFANVKSLPRKGLATFQSVISGNNNGALLIASNSWNSVSPWKGKSPKRRQYRVTPKAHISILYVTFTSSTPSVLQSSGAKKAGVPAVLANSSSPPKCAAKEIPKSEIFTTPFLSTSKLDGFMSLWTIPW